MTPPPADLPNIADPSTFAARAQAWVLWQSVFYAELATIIGTTIPAGSAAAGTLTGNTLAANVINSSLAPRGWIAGLTLSNNATVTKLDVAAGICKDSTNAVSITLSAAITAGLIQTSGAWAAGSTQNKLDTGARANSTWYHVWAIMKDSDNSGDFLFSLSVSAPTMPTGYTYKRRIGSVLTDGSGNITAFVQTGDYFAWATPVVNYQDITSAGSSAVTRTLTVPTGVNVLVDGRVSIQRDATGNEAVLLTDLAGADVAPASNNAHVYTSFVIDAAGTRISPFLIRSNTSAQVRSRQSSGSANSYFSMAVRGWFDDRGING